MLYCYLKDSITVEMAVAGNIKHCRNLYSKLHNALIMQVLLVLNAISWSSLAL